jgi:hypothetical protein
MNSSALSTYDSVRLWEFVRWFPAIEQQRMMSAWLADNEFGDWTQTGLVTAADRTVITPNADMNYGYCWFNLADGPIVVDVPTYRRYLSLSVFDMNHFIPAVLVNPEKPLVVRLATQPPLPGDAHDVILGTVTGLLFLRMVIPEPSDEAEVLELTKQIRSSGGRGELPFIIPSFTEDETARGVEVIQSYALAQTTAEKVFGAPQQGVGDMDRCAGVVRGQLGIPAPYVQYRQYVALDGEPLGGARSYALTFESHGMVRADGYWSVTVYDSEDRYLIPNPANKYSITSYSASPNADGTVTVRINPEGSGDNALPTKGRSVYVVFRAYQPRDVVDFPDLVLA